MQLDFGAATEPGSDNNRLPYDGQVRYWGRVLNNEQAEHFLQRLLNEPHWQHDEAIIYGKHIVTARQYAWYADKCYRYNYSGVARQAQLWIPLLEELRAIVENQTQQKYNSCLLNFYPDGSSGMAWHSDDEKELIKHGSIASLSFGAGRKFALKHKASKEKVDFILGAGDLLEMSGPTQDHWLHSIAKTKKVLQPRINLTFRQMR